MSDTIKVEAATDERSPEQAARAAPVSLPAGSYDSEALQKDLDEAAKAKNAGQRAELVNAALDKHNETVDSAAPLDLEPGYRRITVEDENAGVTETRVVYDPKIDPDAEDDKPKASASTSPVAPAPASKGE